MSCRELVEDFSERLVLTFIPNIQFASDLLRLEEMAWVTIQEPKNFSLQDFHPQNVIR